MMMHEKSKRKCLHLSLALIRTDFDWTMRNEYMFNKTFTYSKFIQNKIKNIDE